MLKKLFLRFPHWSFPDSLARSLDFNWTGLWPDVRERPRPEPGRDCSDQNGISFQFQSARILGYADIHVARPDMSHGSEIGV
jgi:hypothetical protein